MFYKLFNSVHDCGHAWGGQSVQTREENSMTWECDACGGVRRPAGMKLQSFNMKQCLFIFDLLLTILKPI